MWQNLKSLTPLTLMFTSGVALAHTTGETDGLMSGIAHPYSGLDHMLAMIAVGLWAAQQSWRHAFWQIPAAFVLMMAAGAVLGYTGMPLPQVEAGIAASVLVLGLVVALALQVPSWASIALVATFALFHGHAHGTEAAAGSFVTYLLGFTLATASLHALGVAFAWLTQRRWGERLLRASGAATAAAGVWFLIAAF